MRDPSWWPLILSSEKILLMDKKYFLEHKGPLKGLLVELENESVSKLSHSCDNALNFDSRYKARKFLKQHKVENHFRILFL